METLRNVLNDRHNSLNITACWIQIIHRTVSRQYVEHAGTHLPNAFKIASHVDLRKVDFCRWNGNICGLVFSTATCAYLNIKDLLLPISNLTAWSYICSENLRSVFHIRNPLLEKILMKGHARCQDFSHSPYAFY